MVSFKVHTVVPVFSGGATVCFGVFCCAIAVENVIFAEFSGAALKSVHNLLKFLGNVPRRLTARELNRRADCYPNRARTGEFLSRLRDRKQSMNTDGHDRNPKINR